MIVSTDSSKPGPNLVWILKATSTMCFATSFSVMGVTSVSRKGAKPQRKTAKLENQNLVLYVSACNLKTQWLQRSRFGALEKPARTHSQTVMPRWQALSIKRKTCLARHSSTQYFSPHQNSSMFRAEAKRFTQLFEMFRSQVTAGEKCLHIMRQQTSLLKCQLGRALKCRYHVVVKGDVSEREDVFITAHLQSWFNHEQATPVFINLELFYQRIHAHPRHPNDCGGFDFGLFMIVLESDALLSHAHNPCVRERLNARMTQSGLDKFANLIAHAWYQAVRHLDHQHARLATQRATFHGVA